MRDEALVQNFALPIRKRQLTHAHGDPVPERLHVVDLLVDGEIVESRRWHPKRMRHAVSLPSLPGRLNRNRPCLGGTADKTRTHARRRVHPPSVSASAPNPSAFDHGTSSRCVALVMPT